MIILLAHSCCGIALLWLEWAQAKGSLVPVATTRSSLQATEGLG